MPSVIHRGAGTFGSDAVSNRPQLGTITSLFEADAPVWAISLLTCGCVRPSGLADGGEREQAPRATEALTQPGLFLVPRSARRQKPNARFFRRFAIDAAKSLKFSFYFSICRKIMISVDI